MAKHSALSSYAKIIGEIAIEWNKLEIRFDGLIFDYLQIESDVAGFILGLLGNQSKADLATLLISKYETNEEAKQNALLCVSLMNRLRENRNILEHAIPHLNYDRRYIGTIKKLDKKYDSNVFVAPMTLLQELLSTMRKADTYIIQVRLCFQKPDNEDEAFRQRMNEALIISTSLSRPLLPDKISPLVLPEVPEGDRPRQQSHRPTRQQKKSPRK